MKDPITD